MKHKIWFLLAVILGALGAPKARAVEDWKGKTPTDEVTLGAMAGLGFIDSGVGFLVTGNVAKKLLDHGFIPDINNQVFVEVELGPLFIKGTTAFDYSLQLRWDFNKDPEWTFYAIGGVGGTIMGSTLSDQAPVFFRFGLGAFWHIAPVISLRAQVSHEAIVTGVSVAF